MLVRAGFFTRIMITQSILSAIKYPLPVGAKGLPMVTNPTGLIRTMYYYLCNK